MSCHHHYYRIYINIYVNVHSWYTYIVMTLNLCVYLLIFLQNYNFDMCLRLYVYRVVKRQIIYFFLIIYLFILFSCSILLCDLSKIYKIYFYCRLLTPFVLSKLKLKFLLTTFQCIVSSEFSHFKDKFSMAFWKKQ